MENNLISQKKSIFDKIKDFAFENKEFLKTTMAVLMLIMAIYNMRYLFSGFGGLFEWGFIHSVASLLGIVSRGLGVLGFGAIGIILLTKKKEEFISVTPYLIGGSYLVYAVSAVLWIFFIGSFSMAVTALIQLAMGILWIFAGISVSKPKSAEEKDKLMKMMLVAPVVILAIRIILSAIGIAYSITFINIILSLIETGILILFALTTTTIFKEIYENKEEFILENNTVNTVANNNVAQPMPEGYSEVWKVVVFSIITFGIYFFIWIYRTVGLLNRKTLEDQSQGLQVVLCLFVPFYIIYWMYKEAKRVEIYSARVGNKNNDLSIISLILAIFGFSIVSVALMQDQINKNLLVEAGIASTTYAYNEPQAKPATEVPTQVSSAQTTEGVYETKTVKNVETQTVSKGINSNDIELLKKLKDLLDAGILTEEEFESEKKKVLNK